MLFTCLHTRSVHVEIVDNCSTQELLNALRRFIGHCGRPKTFYSDNAKYFKGADSSLKELALNIDFKKIQSETYRGEAAIEWQYSTPEAPWTNGITERMVGLFKKQLRVILQSELLTPRELQTLLIELKCIINDRPLGVMNMEATDWTTITPNLLVYGRPMCELVNPTDAQLANLNFAEIWLTRKRLLNKFWGMWLRQYLQELSLCQKWKKNVQSKLKAGDVIILKPETLHKNVWNLGIIEDVQRNPEGAVSVVTVRRPNGKLAERSVRQVALLEPNCHDEEEADFKSSHGTGREGSGNQMLPDPLSGGLLGEVIQPPDLNRPRQENVMDANEADPGNAVIVASDPVPSSSSGLECEMDARVPPVRPLRKQRRRKGYYRDLAKGILAKEVKKKKGKTPQKKKKKKSIKKWESVHRNKKKRKRLDTKGKYQKKKKKI